MEQDDVLTVLYIGIGMIFTAATAPPKGSDDDGGIYTMFLICLTFFWPGFLLHYLTKR